LWPQQKITTKNALEDVALVVGTLQNLSNLYSIDIYGCNTNKTVSVYAEWAKVTKASRE
jgi:hypothetical protein